MDSAIKRLPIRDDWFEAYEVGRHLFVLREPRHYEETIVCLLVGERTAVLIDTGCGIGDLLGVVAQITSNPVTVVNTHTHLDHLGGNDQFSRIAMFDHPLSRRMATGGVSGLVVAKEILAEGLVMGALPRSFAPARLGLAPFAVDRWLRDGDEIHVGDLELEVIHTPGEAPDHICLLDRHNRVLFCGDILLRGPVWTHLRGGSLKDLIGSYRRLMDRFEEFDHLMPGHNEPWIDKQLLPEALNAAERVEAGEAPCDGVVVDPWGRRAKQYSFGRFQILTS